MILDSRLFLPKPNSLSAFSVNVLCSFHNGPVALATPTTEVLQWLNCATEWSWRIGLISNDSYALSPTAYLEKIFVCKIWIHSTLSLIIWFWFDPVNKFLIIIYTYKRNELHD